MNCDNIKQNLQTFFEDLLAEEEYKAFCAHIEICDKCKVYVRSIGSLSNQLWKLGQIEVPQDLISSVQYKLVHPEEKEQPAKAKITKKQIVAGIALIISIIVLVLGTSYFKKQRAKPPKESKAKALLNQPDAITTKIGAATEDNIIEREIGKEGPKD